MKTCMRCQGEFTVRVETDIPYCGHCDRRVRQIVWADVQAQLGLFLSHLLDIKIRREVK